MINYNTHLISAFVWLKMWLVKHTLLRPLIRDALNPEKKQEDVLRYILEQNKDTEIGKHYNFSAIKNVDDYIKNIPIHEYEDLRPYIEKQIESTGSFIVSQQPIMYAQTSGTTSKAKYIPILKQTVNSYKRAQSIFSFIQYHTVPKIFSGKILAIVSPAVEGYLNNKIPCGSMSGLIYEAMPDAVSSKYVLPQEVLKIENYNDKYFLMAAFALYDASITCLATANPSTLLRISDVIHEHSDRLIAFVETGNLDVLGARINDEQIKRFLPYCKANPDRAQALSMIKQTKGELRFIDIWPDLRAVVTWMHGNCALLLPRLKRQLSTETKIIEMGYLSSEFRGTITIDCLRNLGIPTIQDNFFEFVEVDKWHAGDKNTLLLSQIEIGKKYYILVTTTNGLYRYFINDIVEVTGRYQNTPTIAFVQKGKGITNLTGEKLYESQVVSAVQAASKSQDISTNFFIMLADQQDFSYTLYIETQNDFDSLVFTEGLHQHLCQLNIEYQSKAESGRIKAVQVKRLKPKTYEMYKSHCIKAGQREGQFKVIKLQYRSDMNFPFDEYIAL